MRRSQRTRRRVARAVRFVDRELVCDAIEHLRIARNMLAGCGARKAADKVRRAMKSAEGAQRHVDGLHSRVFPATHTFWRQYRPRVSTLERLYPLPIGRTAARPDGDRRNWHARKPVCPQCRGDDIALDAAARWSCDHQQWEVSSVFDGSGACGDCDARDVTPSWVHLSALSAPSMSCGYTIREEWTQEVLATGLTEAQLREWWNQNEKRYFKLRVIDDRLIEVHDMTRCAQ